METKKYIMALAKKCNIFWQVEQETELN